MSWAKINCPAYMQEPLRKTAPKICILAEQSEVVRADFSA